MHFFLLNIAEHETVSAIVSISYLLALLFLASSYLLAENNSCSDEA